MIYLRGLWLNAENAFVLLDEPLKQNLELLPERAWQALSTSTYENKPLHKLFGLRKVIQEIQPDVLCLCEVGGHESLENFNRYFLDGAYTVFMLEGNSDRGIDLGFLVKLRPGMSALVISHRYTPLKMPANLRQCAEGVPFFTPERFSRDVAELQVFFEPGAGTGFVSNSDSGIENHSTAKPVATFMAVHLKSKRRDNPLDPGGYEQRRAEILTLVDLYQQRLNGNLSDYPIFVLGDFNGAASLAQPEADFAPLHSQTNLVDVFDEVALPESDRITFWTRRGRKPLGLQLDYVFINQNARHRLVSSAYVYRYKDPNGRVKDMPTRYADKYHLPSDHYPIVFDFSVC